MARIETERLTLREYRPEDLAAHHRLMSDQKTMYFLDDIATGSLEESRKNLENAMAQAALGEGRDELFLAVCLKGGAEVMGSAGYTVTQRTPAGKVVHAGYFLRPEYHGKGYMTEAFGALLRHAFCKDGVCRVDTGCYAENAASERVMIKCGMEKVQAHPAAAWHDGRLKDRLAYRLHKEEWGKAYELLR